MIKPPDVDKEFGMLVYASGGGGIGGRVRVRAEEFRVSEVVRRVVGLAREGNGYPLYVVTKKGVDTLVVADELSRRVSCRVSVLGLKDKLAVATQFMVCLNRAEGSRCLELVRGRSWVARLAGLLERPLRPRDLIGNSFKILVRDCDPSRIDVLDEVKAGLERMSLPNFYGYQRFGAKTPNHIVGRLIVKREYERAVKLLGLERFNDPVRAIRSLPFKIRRLLINSYQSYLFNMALSRVLVSERGLVGSEGGLYFRVEGKPFPHTTGDPVRSLDGKSLRLVPAAPLPGYALRLGGSVYEEALMRVLDEEGVVARDFYIDEMPEISVEGGWRPAAVLGRLDWVLEEDGVRLTLLLQRGSFATVVLREVMKPGDPIASGLLGS